MKYPSIYRKGGYDIEWKDILFLEDKIMNMIYDVYHIKYIRRIEIEGGNKLQILNIYIKHNNINYKIVVSKKDNNIGFSIYNIDDYDVNRKFINKTLINDRMCVYKIYKMILQLL